MSDLRRRIAQAVDPWFPNPEVQMPLVLDAIMDAVEQTTPASKPLPEGQGPELTIEQIKAMEKLP